MLWSWRMLTIMRILIQLRSRCSVGLHDTMDKIDVGDDGA